MQTLEGEQWLVRIIIGDGDTWHLQSLHMALLERLRREGFAGATVTHGIAGFGAHSRIHSAHVVRLSDDLPVIIEIVERGEQVERMKPILDEMINDGIVTIERVHVLRYRAGEHAPAPEGP